MTFTAVMPGTKTFTAAAVQTASGKYGTAQYGSAMYGVAGVVLSAKTAGTLTFTAK